MDANKRCAIGAVCEFAWFGSFMTTVRRAKSADLRPTSRFVRPLGFKFAQKLPESSGFCGGSVFPRFDSSGVFGRSESRISDVWSQSEVIVETIVLPTDDFELMQDIVESSSGNEIEHLEQKSKLTLVRRMIDSVSKVEMMLPEGTDELVG